MDGGAGDRWAMALLVAWLLAAWRDSEGAPIAATALGRQVGANLGSGRVPAAFVPALRNLVERGFAEGAGENPSDPLFSLTPNGERWLGEQDAQVRAIARSLGRTVEEMGIRGPYPGARALAMAHVRKWRGEGARLTKH